MQKKTLENSKNSKMQKTLENAKKTLENAENCNDKSF